VVDPGAAGTRNPQRARADTTLLAAVARSDKAPACSRPSGRPATPTSRSPSSPTPVLTRTRRCTTYWALPSYCMMITIISDKRRHGPCLSRGDGRTGVRGAEKAVHLLAQVSCCNADGPCRWAPRMTPSSSPSMAVRAFASRWGKGANRLAYPSVRTQSRRAWLMLPPALRVGGAPGSSGVRVLPATDDRDALWETWELAVVGDGRRARGAVLPAGRRVPLTAAVCQDRGPVARPIRCMPDDEMPASRNYPRASGRPRRGTPSGARTSTPALHLQAANRAGDAGRGSPASPPGRSWRKLPAHQPGRHCHVGDTKRHMW
jgi:hypothetical protein